MLVLSDKEVLPNIFMATKQVFDSTVENVEYFKNKVLESENPESIVQTFFEKYNKYQMQGFGIFKSAIGDFCVGVRALGNKFGALGGDSFVALKETAEEIVAKSGDFFNFMSSFLVSAEEVLNKSEKNVERFVALTNNATSYLQAVSVGLNKLSDATKFLYGDAKGRLGDRFATMSAPIVNFIHMAKVKIVAAIANCVVGIKVMYDSFAGLVEQNTELPFANYTIVNNGELVKDEVRKLLDALIQEFDEALTQAKSVFAA